MMTPAELACAARRTEQKWYELVMAEQQGASMQVLEHLYSQYMLAVEEYNRASLAQGRQESVQDAVNPRPSAIGSFSGS